MYEKSCYTCGGIITMRKNDTGQWRPFDLDGELHSCSGKNNDLDSVNKNVSSDTSTNQGQCRARVRASVQSFGHWSDRVINSMINGNTRDQAIKEVKQ